MSTERQDKTARERTHTEIAEAARGADILRREARLLREKADQLDDGAARIEAHFGIVPIATGATSG